MVVLKLMTKEEQQVIDALQNNVWYICRLIQKDTNLGIKISNRGRTAQKAANITRFLNNRRSTQAAMIPGTYVYQHFHRSNLIDHGII